MALFSARISRLLPDIVGQWPTSDTDATPTLFFVKRMALGSGRGFEKRKIMWALFSRTSHYFPVTSLFVLPSSFPFSTLLLNPSFRARVTIPREPVIFTPKWPVSSNWTMITRTITTRIIATVIRKITVPEVISLIVKDCPIYDIENDNF